VLLLAVLLLSTLPTWGFLPAAVRSPAAYSPPAASSPPTGYNSRGGALSAKVSYKKMGSNIDSVFEGNARWIASKKAADPDYFTKLGSEHHPKYLWIGCSDARVHANEIIGEDSGSVFTVRNIANIVCGTDFNLMSALQYAVGVLEVPHIIVCGHYECGGVRASIVNKDHVPPLENWLRNIRDVYRLHRAELDAIEDPEQRHRRLVELNVIEQCINLFKTGVVQRKRVETYASDKFSTTQPRIHAVVFDPKTGKLNQLKVDFSEYIDELHGIYDLYEVDEFLSPEDAKMKKIVEKANYLPQTPFPHVEAESSVEWAKRLQPLPKKVKQEPDK
jgi:carbonic anhydrase